MGQNVMYHNLKLKVVVFVNLVVRFSYGEYLFLAIGMEKLKTKYEQPQT